MSGEVVPMCGGIVDAGDDVNCRYWKSVCGGDIGIDPKGVVCRASGNEKMDGNKAKGFRWLRNAANLGDEFACYKLAECYEQGCGTQSNAVKAADCFARFVKWATKAAEKGDANAQCNLGWCYACGEGVETDKVEAVKWYRKAAEQGGVGGQISLGACYATGRGVEKDLSETVKWMRKAAELGDSEAQRVLGLHYAQGEGVKKDLAEAVKWFHKAAGQGDFNAQLNLGWCYAAGEGVEKDVAESDRWNDRASQKYPSLVRIYRNFRWVILSLELIIIYVMGLFVFMAEYPPSIVLQYMRSKQHPFLQLSPGYPGLIMCLVGALALWVGASCVDNLGFGENVVKAEFGSVGSVRMIGELLAIMHLFLQLAAFAFIFHGIRRFMKWRRMRVSLASLRLAYVQYKICVTAEMGACLIPILWLAYIFTLVGRPILVGVSALVLVALLVYMWPTQKKYAKIINGKMTKYTVIYREFGESKPKQTVLESGSESSLRRECEGKGRQVLLIRAREICSPARKSANGRGC